MSHVVKEQDLGTRSGCHSNMPEIHAVCFLTFYLFNFFIYLFLFVSVVSFVSVASFRSFRLFRWFRFGRFVSLFRVLVHAYFTLSVSNRAADYSQPVTITLLFFAHIRKL